MTAIFQGSQCLYEPCKLVAEIGCNHMGQLDIAKELMSLAKKAGATYVRASDTCQNQTSHSGEVSEAQPTRTANR